MTANRKGENYDALVIGAGPAGGVAALMLARAGWNVVIVEKSAFPRRKVCGEFISATSLPMLFQLGLGECFQVLAGPEIRRVGLFARDSVLEAPMPQVTGPYGAWGRALGREHLDLMLLDAAIRAGATVRQPAAVCSVIRQGDGWRCEVESKKAREQLNARVIIAACGSWQAQSFSTPPPATRRSSDLFGFKAHFRNTGLSSDLMPLLVFPGGYGGMVHSDGGRVSLSCCIRRDTLQLSRERGSSRAGEAVLHHLQRSSEGVGQALRDATIEETWLSAGPIRPGIRKRYRDGIFVVGNLAGEAHPVVAEGISMAMQSACQLCHRLIETDDLDQTALDHVGRSYTAAWRKSHVPRIMAAAAIAHLVMRPAAVTLWLPLLEHFPKILTYGAELSGKAKLLPMFK
jgi:flavin-dependent dehydrogenase